MGEVIELKDPLKWADTTLAKKQLAWTKKQAALRKQLDFEEAIAKEELIIRSFMAEVRDQLVA